MTNMIEPVEPSEWLKAIKAKVVEPHNRRISEFTRIPCVTVEHEFSEVMHFQIEHRVSVEFGKSMWLPEGDKGDRAIKNVWLDLHDKMYRHLKDPLLELHRAICDGKQDEARERCQKIMEAVFYGP